LTFTPVYRIFRCFLSLTDKDSPKARHAKEHDRVHVILKTWPMRGGLAAERPPQECQSVSK